MRVLIFDEAGSSGTIVWNGFGQIARRYGITNGDPQFAAGTGVVAAIVPSVKQ